VHALAPSLAAVMSSLRGLKNRREVMGWEWREGRSTSCLPEDSRNTCGDQGGCMRESACGEGNKIDELL